ncbi:MAG: hypothetical protein H0W96_03960, partial [Solirubrobacterales bacterium]|nr:hypothetical protein [Solirubrobacterales bacterium]
MGEPVRGQDARREADALHAALVEQDRRGGVLGVGGLGRDAVGLPQRLQPARAAERPAHAAVHAVLERERAGAPRRVVGGIDADGDDRHVVADVVERDPDLRRRQRTGL